MCFDAGRSVLIVGVLLFEVYKKSRSKVVLDSKVPNRLLNPLNEQMMRLDFLEVENAIPVPKKNRQVISAPLTVEQDVDFRDFGFHVELRWNSFYKKSSLK